MPARQQQQRPASSHLHFLANGACAYAYSQVQAGQQVPRDTKTPILWTNTHDPQIFGPKTTVGTPWSYPENLDAVVTAVPEI